MKKKSLALIALIVIIGYFAYSSGMLANVGFGVFLPGEDVYVPRIGSIRCEAGSITNMIYSSGSCGVEKSFGLIGSSETVTSLVSKGAIASEINKVCNGTSCLVSSPNLSTFGCNRAVWEVTINGKMEEQSTFSFGQYTIIDPTSQQWTVLENQNIRIRAVCIMDYSILGTKTKSPCFSNPVGITNKELVIYADGTKTNIPSSVGCVRNDVLNKVASVDNYPQPVTQNAFNLTTTGTGTPTATYKTISLPDAYPSPLNVGSEIQFVFEWKSLKAFGATFITLSDGTDVVALPNHSVWKVESIPLQSGSIKIANTLYKQFAECITQNECVATLGTGAKCDTLSGKFVCTKEAIQVQCDNVTKFCDLPFFTSEGGSSYLVSYSCVNNQCIQSKQQKVCNPNTNFGCSGSTPICNPDGTACIAVFQPKVDCPSGNCCLSGSPEYYPRNCESGFECKTNGGYVGICVKEVEVEKCGDGICSDNERASQSCLADCPIEPMVCSEGYHLVEKEQPIYLLDFWGIKAIETGKSKTTECVPDFPMDLVLIGIFGLGFAALVLPRLIKKRR